MALPARVSTIISFHNAKQTNNFSKPRLDTKTAINGGRRELLLLSTATATAMLSDSQTNLLNKYLQKSQENKAKNDKERLDSYYKRNYKDYFQLLEGDLKQKNEKDLTESERGILNWLESNK